MFPDRTTALIAKLCAVGIAAALMFLWGYGNGKDRWEGKFDAEKAAHGQSKHDHAAVLAHLADLTKKAEDAVRAREATYAADTAANDKRNKTEKAHALAAKDRVIADLRAGRVRMHDWWTPNLSCPGDAASPAAAAGEVRAGELREEGAGDLVQIGREADAERAWYITELIATRALCGTR